MDFLIMYMAIAIEATAALAAFFLYIRAKQKADALDGPGYPEIYKKAENYKKTAVTMLVSTILTTFVSTAISTELYHIGVETGPSDSMTDWTAYTHVTRSQPKPGEIFIWFRYGCSDCEKARERINGYLESNSREPVWRCTRAVELKNAKEKYPVNSVPSAVLVKPDGTYVSKPLYDRKTDTVLTENLDRLFTLQEKWSPETQNTGTPADKSCEP